MVPAKRRPTPSAPRCCSSTPDGACAPPDVRSAAQARNLVEAAGRVGALIVFTVVNRDAAQVLRDHGASLGVPCVDLLGPLISNIAEHLHAEPRLERVCCTDSRTPISSASRRWSSRCGTTTARISIPCHGADIVLTGVSRTSKTPLSMYLAQRGYKTGNVPLVPGVEPPRQLFDLNPRKVFGLVGDVENLTAMRRARARSMHSGASSQYANAEAIRANSTSRCGCSARAVGA